MSLQWNTQAEQKAVKDAINCAKQFVQETADRIEDIEFLYNLTDAMELLHSISTNLQFIAFLQIVYEALDITMLPQMPSYYNDEAVSDLFLSCFMDEVMTAVMNEIGGVES